MSHILICWEYMLLVKLWVPKSTIIVILKSEENEDNGRIRPTWEQKRQDLSLLEQNLPILFDIISTVILLFQCYSFSLLTSDNSLPILSTLFIIQIFFT